MEQKKMDIGELIMIAALKQKKMINKIITNNGYNFEFAHLKILTAIIKSPENVYAKNLVALEQKSKSTINALLNKLEAEKLIVVETDKKDKRSKVIKATKKGREVDAALVCEVENLVLSQFMKGISLQETDEFYRIVKIIISNIDEIINEI